MHYLEIGFTFLIALLIMLILIQIGSVNRNAIVGVGLLMMVTLNIMIAIVYFID